MMLKMLGEMREARESLKLDKKVEKAAERRREDDQERIRRDLMSMATFLRSCSRKSEEKSDDIAVETPWKRARAHKEKVYDGNSEIETFGRYIHDAELERIGMEAEKCEKNREEHSADRSAAKDTGFAKMKVSVEALLAAKK